MGEDEVLEDAASPVWSFVLPDVPRERICGGEPMPDGHHAAPWHQDVDWIGTAQQGGGHVPDDYEWPSGPRERQERESSG